MSWAQETGAVSGLVFEPSNRTGFAFLSCLVSLIARHTSAASGVVDPQTFAFAKVGRLGTSGHGILHTLAKHFFNCKKSSELFPNVKRNQFSRGWASKEQFESWFSMNLIT